MTSFNSIFDNIKLDNTCLLLFAVIEGQIEQDEQVNIKNIIE